MVYYAGFTGLIFWSFMLFQNWYNVAPFLLKSKRFWGKNGCQVIINILLILMSEK